MAVNKLKNYYMDLHIHIGAAKSGRPVKITASRNLTLEAVLEEASFRKGLDIIGVIDAQSPEVLEELEELIDQGRAVPLKGGGIRFEEKVTLIPGSELEVYDQSCQGPVHLLCYFPGLKEMRHFSSWCGERVKNIHLSSQRIYAQARELQQKVRELNGLFIPAHIFTPFKSVYGKGVKTSLAEVLDPDEIDAVELGLSSDTYMADQLPELAGYHFVTNSDAHSASKIAREHQVVKLEAPDFSEIAKMFSSAGERRILRNVGLHPKLGKYYRSFCRACELPAVNCLCTGHGQRVMGVSERIRELAERQRYFLENSSKASGIKPARPPYLHQVPLEFIPGCGPKTLNRLLDAFQTEMRVLHEAKDEELKSVIPDKVAEKIIQARAGVFTLKEGGGGIYGKIQ
ncbi:endonuclease Q family protein [Evansella clarkii]|uniref:endonuclease Q family protein n=1 Tax=Evansella clarkii TaxID=79879 RepID=UPI000B449954|nr:endonuclease Q family protein [Evansella clarkii]